MVDIVDYLKLSDSAQRLRDIYISSDSFVTAYNNIFEIEKDSFIRHIIIQNVPFAFKEKPLLFEQIIQYLADKLNISPNSVKLIGSAKTGFSISPQPNYGKPFSNLSDLDFSIVSEHVFSLFESEFNSWAKQYEEKSLMPINENQEKFWPQNLINCRQTLKRGFIDTYKIPSHNQFSNTQLINQSLFLIRDRLEKVFKIPAQRASARVYKTWGHFKRQLKLNTEIILNSL